MFDFGICNLLSILLEYATLAHKYCGYISYYQNLYSAYVCTGTSGVNIERSKTEFLLSLGGCGGRDPAAVATVDILLSYGIKHIA